MSNFDNNQDEDGAAAEATRVSWMTDTENTKLIFSEI